MKRSTTVKTTHDASTTVLGCCLYRILYHLSFSCVTVALDWISHLEKGP